MNNYGWWIAIAGIGMMSHNVYSLVVFVINWAMMTIVLINTEESEGRSWKEEITKDFVHKRDYYGLYQQVF